MPLRSALKIGVVVTACFAPVSLIADQVRAGLILDNALPRDVFRSNAGSYYLIDKDPDLIWVIDESGVFKSVVGFGRSNQLSTPISLQHFQRL